MMRALSVSTCTAVGLCAFAAAAEGASDDFSIPTDGPAKVETDSENIFGFTEGTDTQKQGEREISLYGVGRFGKRRFGPGEPLRLPAGTDPAARGDDDDDRPVASPAAAI